MRQTSGLLATALSLLTSYRSSVLCLLIKSERAQKLQPAVRRLSEGNLFTEGRAAHALQSICAHNKIKESHPCDLWIIYILS